MLEKLSFCNGKWSKNTTKILLFGTIQPLSPVGKLVDEILIFFFFMLTNFNKEKKNPEEEDEQGRKRQR